MSPPRATAFVHLGDTSFRRKEVIAGYHTMLEVLTDFRNDGRAWDKETQLEFYGLVRNQAPDLFDGGTAISEDRAAQRGRTLTNALVKIGFVNDDERRITGLGRMFAAGDPRRIDDFDRRCQLKPENSAVLRGALSFTDRTATGGYFFPVRLLLRVLIRLGALSTDEFAAAFIVAPEIYGVDVDAVVGLIEAMRADGRTLHDVLLAAERTPAQTAFIDSGDAQQDAFPNGKSPKYVAQYLAFVDTLGAFREAPNPGTLARLRRAVDGAGSGLTPLFKPTTYLPDLRKSATSPLAIHASARYPEWHGDAAAFRRVLVDMFNGNRATKRGKEYRDNNLRLLTATGMISVAGNQVSISAAYARYFFAAIDDELAVLTDRPPTDSERLAGLVELFGTDSLERTDARIVAEQGIAPDKIQEFIGATDRARFDQIISDTFSPEDVLAHLRLIAEDHRSAAVERLRKNVFRGKPTVPCMYEYLVGLSLYYAGDRAFDLRSAYGLTLDGDFLPLNHAPGLRGDIEFELAGRRVLAEVTLMDPGNQRRNELEPVLRHATNLACEFPGTEVLTLFIANEVDANVARILGFARLMKLTATDGTTGSASPLIVSIPTRDWVDIATVPLPRTLALIAAEAGRMDVDHVNSDWDGRLVRALKQPPSS